MYQCSTILKLVLFESITYKEAKLALSFVYSSFLAQHLVEDATCYLKGISTLLYNCRNDAVHSFKG